MAKKGSFLTSLPGILTGVAAIITAVGGLLLILNQVEPGSDQAEKLPRQQTSSTEPGSAGTTEAGGEANNTGAPKTPGVYLTRPSERGERLSYEMLEVVPGSVTDSRPTKKLHVVDQCLYVDIGTERHLTTGDIGKCNP